MGQGIPIGELARRSLCPIETIRYYERIGILPAPPRAGRFRRYDRAALARLAFVRRARQLGFSLDQVRDLLRLATPNPAAPNPATPARCGQARALARAHLADLRARLADLRRLIGALDAMQRGCAGADDADCPILTLLFAPPDAA